MIQRRFKLIILFCLMLMFRVSEAAVINVDFESFSDLEAITNQVAGMTFSNASVLSSGFSLNEAEFPPRSGFNVVVDDGGELTVDFALPVAAVGGYFTYLTQLTFSAYDSALNLVATDVSDFLSNLALSGDAGSSPNEFLGVSAVGGISRIVVSGDPSGFSFVLDDLTVTTAQIANVPEPGTLPLVMIAFVAAGLYRHLLRVRAQQDYGAPV